MPASEQRKQLNSWKEIASVLGVSVRTTQKWEAERGLPVRRSAGEKGRVSASLDELEQWQAANLRKREWWHNPVLIRAYALVATALVLAAVGLGVTSRLISQRKGPPALSRLESNFLIVTDSQGRELWRHGFSYLFAPGAYADQVAKGDRWAWFGNLDRDPEVEMLFVYHPVGRDPAGASLICYGKGGREKWRFSAGRPVSDRAGAYSRDYRIATFLVADVAGTGSPQILVSSQHVSGHPNQFVLLSSDGKVLGEYWHSGHLPELNVADLDGDGRLEILLAGVDSGYREATLIALDPAHATGASQQPAGDVHQLQGFPPAAEKARLLFPRTCANRTLDEFNQAAHLIVRDGLIELAVTERDGDPANRAIYTFGANLRVANVRFSDEWRRYHRELELKRVLDHPLTDEEMQRLATPEIIADPARAGS